MKLKNFIEVNVDENAYNSEGALIFENPQKKAYINTKHISEFSDNVIWTFGNIKTKVIETAEQIQKKIFECQNIDKVKYSCSAFDNTPDAATQAYDAINRFINGKGIEENVKGLKPEHQEIIKSYNKPNTTRTGSQKPF